MAGVMCVGIATQDLVFGLASMPVTPEKHRAKSFAAVGGGIAATAAVAVARLGGRAMLCARLGDDRIGRDIIDALVADGVDCSLVHHMPGIVSPISAVLVDDAGDRLIVNYADMMPPAGEAVPERLPDGVGAVMADTRWTEGGLRALASARAAGCPGVLDADRRPENPELATMASHVAYAAQAVREITGLEDPRAGLEAIAATARNWVAVTDGGNGTWFTQDGRIAHEPAFPIVPVDTLGAGDVFHGALALGLAEGMDERAAVRFASAAAAIKCTRFGGRAGAPTRAEVEAFMTDHAGRTPGCR